MISPRRVTNGIEHLRSGATLGQREWHGTRGRMKEASGFRFIVMHIVWFLVWIAFNILSQREKTAILKAVSLDERPTSVP
jgi:uncharacterized membrane protein